MAEIIRQLLDRWSGKYTDTATDVSSRHDEYLSEAWGI